MLDFLEELFTHGASASSIGTHRSALSLYLPQIEGYQVGEHPLVIRFMKGVKNRRPMQPRYQATWDTNTVVNFLKTFDHSGNLKALAHKLTMLLALVTAQRAQTLSKLRLSEMTEKDGAIVFRIGDHLKTKQPGTATITLTEFPHDRSICVVTLLKLYVEQTKHLRNDDYLLMSPIKPHKAVHVDTIRRWLMHIMKLAGVDVEEFKAHSTRSASSSKAKEKQVPLDSILAAGMWKSETTFSKFYHKTVRKPEDQAGQFQNAILHTD